MDSVEPSTGNGVRMPWARRAAAGLGLFGVMGALILSCACGRFVLSVLADDALTSTGAVTAALAAVGTLAAARISVACASAIPHLLAPNLSGRRSSQDRTQSRPITASRCRMGSTTAAMLLGLVTSLSSASVASAATPPAVTLNVTAQGADASGLPMPDFSPLPPDDHAASPAEVSTDDDPHQCEAPAPGWTPPAVAFNDSTCLITGKAHRSEVREYTVTRGDTLWSIAAQELAETASAAEVAERVQAWIEANPMLQTHPDLLRAGDQLLCPTTTSMSH